MPDHIYHISSRLVVLGGVLLIVSSARGADPPAPMPHTLTFHADGLEYLPRFQPGGERCWGDCWWGQTVVPAPEKQVARLRINAGSYKVVHPQVRRGDIIPVVRGIYRVESMTPGRRERGRENPASVTCRRVDNPPMGVALKEGGYTFPFNRPDGLKDPNTRSSFTGRGTNYTTFSAKYQRGEGNARDAVRMIVSTGLELRGGPTLHQTVRVGDVIDFGRQRHRLVNIVPPDPKNHVAGWFEVRVEPEPEAGDKE